jgi:hypothetical protein
MGKDNKEDPDMAVRKEDLKNAQKIAHSQKIREIANKVADRNDEGLRRLSKS